MKYESGALKPPGRTLSRPVLRQQGRDKHEDRSGYDNIYSYMFFRAFATPAEGDHEVIADRPGKV